MGGKRKGRATKRNVQAGEGTEPEELTKAPHSFVITRGNVSGYVQELTKDFRKVMEPFTASSIKSRKKNTLKDFVSISGPLHVSHLCMFTQTELAIYLRVARLPRGPTLTMRVHSYTLSRDVRSSLKKPCATDKLFSNAPLVVMNSFSGEGMHLKLLSSTFQNMFPSINLTKIKLCGVSRVVLLSYDPETKLIDFRHYAIRAVPVGLSRGVKKLVQAKVPDLSRFQDISEFLTKSGDMSESEAEDDPNSHVTLPQDLGSRGNVAATQSAIRLVELGPRITLQLVKVEEGLMEGEVMYHEYVHKTQEEKAKITKIRTQKKRLKESRRKEQEENMRRKIEEKEAHKRRSLKGAQRGEEPAQDDDDAQWFRSEVGQEPDKELFENLGRKRKPDQDESSGGAKRSKLGDQSETKFKHVGSIRKQGFKPQRNASGKRKPGGKFDNDGSNSKGKSPKFVKKKKAFGSKRPVYGSKTSAFGSKKPAFGSKTSNFKGKPKFPVGKSNRNNMGSGRRPQANKGRESKKSR